MTATVRRLVTLARLPVSRVALSLSLATFAVGFGVALLATAGYLISRAAEQPPILSLTVTIVAVRFFGLARPIARYLDRLFGHDLALRALGRIRAGFYARLEPLAPAELASYRRGDLLERMVGDVESLQGLYLRGLGPPLVALAIGSAAVGVTAAFLPAAAVVLAAGLIVAFGGDTSALIPLYAVGVFTCFTLSQAGMVIHHRKLRERGWRYRQVFNAVGAIATGIVLVVVVVSKFTIGAWIPVALIPIIVVVFRSVHRHYVRVASAIEVPDGYIRVAGGKPSWHARLGGAMGLLIAVAVGAIGLAVSLWAVGSFLARLFADAGGSPSA